MDNLEEKEIALFKAEAERCKNNLSGEKISYAIRLNNGLGDIIKKELKNPTKPKKIEIFRYKLNKIKTIIRDKIFSKKFHKNQLDLAQFFH